MSPTVTFIAALVVTAVASFPIHGARVPYAAGVHMPRLQHAAAGPFVRPPAYPANLNPISRQHKACTADYFPVTCYSTSDHSITTAPNACACNGVVLAVDPPSGGSPNFSKCGPLTKPTCCYSGHWGLVYTGSDCVCDELRGFVAPPDVCPPLH